MVQSFYFPFAKIAPSMAQTPFYDFLGHDTTSFTFCPRFPYVSAMQNHDGQQQKVCFLLIMEPFVSLICLLFRVKEINLK